jgi:hypothetical protein
MMPNWLRLAYAAELLLAIPAVFTLWSQVGGQGHLDLMPWYWKLLLGGGLSVACVFATAAAAHQHELVNRRLYAWVAVMILICAGMAAVTYYYHLHETYEDTDEETPSAAALIQDGRRA